MMPNDPLTAIQSFEEFTDWEKVVELDHGEDWEERGYAQRKEIKLYGIYNWYHKFHKEIDLV